LFEIHEHDRGKTFGIAEVTGVKPGQAEEHTGALRELLGRSAVVCLRMDAPLEEAGLHAVSHLFGPVKDPVARTREGDELRYSEPRQIIDAGFVLTDELREKLGNLEFGGLDDRRPGLFETFHCDDTFTEEPAWATVLHARALPPSGGGPTLFIDMRAAYDALSAERKRELEGLRVVYGYDNHDAFPPRRSAKGPGEALVDVVHPLVRTHPVVGTRALFVDLDRARHVEGMPVAEGRALLRELQEEAEAHAPGCRHDWRDHDVLVWDNASVQHKAGGDFPVGEPRRFWRYMVAAERPV
jgi:alpha-ketoglutarate-dependent taurine dioxygenase